MKLIKFGSITENEDGRLVLSGFHADGEHTSLNAQQTLLLLIINRLLLELQEGFNKTDRIY